MTTLNKVSLSPGVTGCHPWQLLGSVPLPPFLNQSMPVADHRMVEVETRLSGVHVTLFPAQLLRKQRGIFPVGYKDIVSRRRDNWENP
jgi:hypothetical protein